MNLRGVDGCQLSGYSADGFESLDINRQRRSGHSLSEPPSLPSDWRYRNKKNNTTITLVLSQVNVHSKEQKWVFVIFVAEHYWQKDGQTEPTVISLRYISHDLNVFLKSSLKIFLHFISKWLQGPSVETPPLSSRRLSECEVSGPLLSTPASPSTRRHRQHAWGFPGRGFSLPQMSGIIINNIYIINPISKCTVLSLTQMLSYWLCRPGSAV